MRAGTPVAGFYCRALGHGVVSRLAVVTVVLVLLGAASGVYVASASSHYTITASPSVDTPTREVTFDGQEFTVSAIARVDPGETVTASVSAPTGDFYSIPLYDSDQRIVDRREGTNDSTVSFETAFEDGEPYEPGTYAIVVSHDGIFQAVHPLVISGYRVSVDAPTSAEEGSEVTVSATVEPVDDTKAISQVRLVIGNDDRDRRTTMAGSGTGEYSTTIEVDQLGTGDYTLYVVVQGEEEALGSKELLGVSDSQPFTIGDGSTGGGGSGGGQGGSTDEGSPTTDEGTTRTTAPTTSSTTQGTGDGTGESDARTTTDGSAVVTPRSPAPTDTAQKSGIDALGQPVGVGVAVVALAGVGWIGLRRIR